MTLTWNFIEYLRLLQISQNVKIFDDHSHKNTEIIRSLGKS